MCFQSTPNLLSQWHSSDARVRHPSAWLQAAAQKSASSLGLQGNRFERCARVAVAASAEGGQRQAPETEFARQQSGASGLEEHAADALLGLPAAGDRAARGDGQSAWELSKEESEF